METLKPDAALLCKLGSIIVHTEEMLSSGGHDFDRLTLQSLLQDEDVERWLLQMGELALIPVKR